MSGSNFVWISMWPKSISENLLKKSKSNFFISGFKFLRWAKRRKIGKIDFFLLHVKSFESEKSKFFLKKFNQKPFKRDNFFASIKKPLFFLLSTWKRNFQTDYLIEMSQITADRINIIYMQHWFFLFYQNARKFSLHKFRTSLLKQKLTK